LQHKKVLVAEDDQEVLDYLREILQEEGYEVFPANNGEEAVEVVENNHVDVAVLDKCMPTMDGIDTLKKIKKINKNTVCLIMTGFADFESLKQAIVDNGAFDYILKPFRKSDFIKVIRNALKKHDSVAKIKNIKKKLKGRSAQLEKEFEERTFLLRESQIKFKQIVENSNDAIVVVQDGILNYANPKALKMTGYGQEEISSISVADLIYPEDRAIVEEQHQRGSDENEIPRTCSFRLLNKDGESLWVESNAIITHWEGRPATLSFLRDIDERKRAEDALKQSEKRYRSLVENTFDGYFIISGLPSGEFIFLNLRFFELFGYTKQETVGLTIWEIISPQDHKVLEHRLRSKIEGKPIDPERWVYRAIRKDGSAFRVEVSTSVVTFQGNPVIQGVLRDVTVEESLQKQLQHAQKMEAIGTLAGGMAHEFNNILAVIQGYSDLLIIEMEPQDPWTDYAKNIRASCQRAATLTQSMLTFARLDSGEKVPVKVNQLIERVQELLQQTLAPEMDFEVELHSGLPFVMADPVRLEQVLLNLAVNARDAMPSGGRLRFRTCLSELDNEFCLTHPWAKPGRYVEINVEDTGTGMSPEVLPRIFEPFFTTKEPGKGTGLGLSVAYSIVKNHEGHILAESQMGQGSCFRIFLPVNQEAVEGEYDCKADGIELFNGYGESVLVVDDESHIREIMKNILHANGYRVALAKNGEEALRLYREAMKKGNRFDLIVLDLAMPVMDGKTCMKHILELDPDSRILIMTGFGRHHILAANLDKRIKGVLLKPLSMETLLGEIRKAIDGNE
jgi:PAS domain S-box-containing protein